MRNLFAICLLLIMGCESATQKKAKIDKATSQVNVIGEKLSRQIDKDGRFIKNIETEKDPWDNDIRIDYTTGWSTPVKNSSGKLYAVLDPRDNIDTLTVVSNGPDGLSHTKDDIGITFKLITREYLKAKEEEKTKGQQARENNIEGNLSAITRGLTKGVFDAYRGKK